MLEEDYFLLHKLKEGDMSAFEVLYIRYAPNIKSFVSAILKNSADADDIVHEIFLKVWENRDSIANVQSFKSYLYSMTRNAVYNKIKRDKVHERFVGFASQNSEAYDSETSIQTKDLLANINKEIEKLPEKQREIYEMSREEEFTYNEISDKLNISPKTVQYHIGQALAKLKKLN